MRAYSGNTENGSIGRWAKLASWLIDSPEFSQVVRSSRVEAIITEIQQRYACLISLQHSQSSQRHCHWKITWKVTQSKRRNFTEYSSNTSMHLIKEGCFRYVPRAIWKSTKHAFLYCRTQTFGILRKSPSFKLHERTQVGPPKELQCALAREDVSTINASAKGQKSLAQLRVTQQQLDLARRNLRGHVAYTFSCSYVHCCQCCRAWLSHFTVLNEFMLKE